MFLFANNAETVLAANITNSQTTMAFATGGGARFPDIAPATGDVQAVTLTDGINFEVVYIVNKTGDAVANMWRANEDPYIAYAWPAGTTVKANVTADLLNNFWQKYSSARVILGDSVVATPSQCAVVGDSVRADRPVPWSTGVYPPVGGMIKATASDAYFMNVSFSFGAFTGASEPTWNVSAEGNITTDNGIEWMYVGSPATYTLSFFTAIGANASTADAKGIAIGLTSNATLESVAIGFTAASNKYASAVGSGARAFAQKCVALGYNALNKVLGTYVITGLSLVRKDRGESASDEHLNFTGAQSLILSKEINLKTLLDDAATITVPTGATFYADEVGVIVTQASGVTGQPSVAFGVTGNTVSVLASTATTKNAVKGRDVFTPLTKDGLNSLTASIKTAATGTTLMGRFYWKGVLVED